MIELSWGIERGGAADTVGWTWGYVGVLGKSGKRWMDGLDPVIRYMML